MFIKCKQLQNNQLNCGPILLGTTCTIHVTTYSTEIGHTSPCFMINWHCWNLDSDQGLTLSLFKYYIPTFEHPFFMKILCTQPFLSFAVWFIAKESKTFLIYKSSSSLRLEFPLPAHMKTKSSKTYGMSYKRAIGGYLTKYQLILNVFSSKSLV